MVPLRVGLSPEDQREPATVATFEQVNLCYAPGQTESGQPAIGVGLRLEDGTLLEGLTTWRLFRLAYRALESRIDGMRQRGELPPRSEDDLNLDVLWQNPVRFAPEVEPRVARIVRHKVSYAAGYDGRVSGGREDEIHVETFSRDARGRSRWCDATEFESVAILKAALASAHMVLDAHRADEKRRRDAMIEALPRRRVYVGSKPFESRDPPEPNGYEKDVEKVEELRRTPPPPRCLKPQEDSPFGCTLPEGHAGKCDPDIPF